MQARRLVLVLSDCADEEKHPPPSQITEVIKQRWDRTPRGRSISLVKVSSVACWLYFLAPTWFLHPTVSTILTSVLCRSYRAASTPLLAKDPQHKSRLPVVTLLTHPYRSAVERRDTPALGLTSPSFRSSAQGPYTSALLHSACNETKCEIGGDRADERCISQYVLAIL